MPDRAQSLLGLSVFIGLKSYKNYKNYKNYKTYKTYKTYKIYKSHPHGRMAGIVSGAASRRRAARAAEARASLAAETSGAEER